MTSRRRGMRQHLTCPLCLLILCHVASTCRVCLPPMFLAAANGTPPNPNWEIDFDWLSNESQIAMARFAVAQHNATKNHSLQPVGVLYVDRADIASTGNGSAGNGSAGNGSAGNGSAGNGNAGNGSAGNGRAGNSSAGREEYLVTLAALNLLRGRTAFFDALLSRRPLEAAQSTLYPLVRGVVASENERWLSGPCSGPCSSHPLPLAGQPAAADLSGGGTGGGAGIHCWQQMRAPPAGSQ
ncbi:unnamed protein product [Closterium sp. NIES-65]|nr:unnamed protein product [Closterium sp. NIES-65]